MMDSMITGQERGREKCITVNSYGEEIGVGSVMSIVRGQRIRKALTKVVPRNDNDILPINH